MRKVLLFLLLVPLLWNSASAQLLFPDKSSTTTPSQTGQPSQGEKLQEKLQIEDAVTNNLIVIQQKYQLKDNTSKRGQYFGRDGKPDFGQVYAVGVKAGDGYFTVAKVQYPWLYDANFEEFKTKIQYTPVVSATSYRDWKGSQYEKLDFTASKSISGDSILFVKSKTFKGKGLSVDASDGRKKGWICWFIQGKDAGGFTVSYQATEIAFESGNTIAEAGGTAPENVAGGIFVSQKSLETGQVATILSGMVFKNDGKWFVKKANEDVESDDVPTGERNSDGLTPAKQKPFGILDIFRK
ncbi:MAG: hypothetical protein LBI58_00940 [Tannerellaceae bacterium]|jgi:hypothetical protein|nr:hypothetical protein [Tannerellaceae bacterium]